MRIPVKLAAALLFWLTPALAQHLSTIAKPFGPEALRVLPDLVAQDGTVHQAANARTARVLSDPGALGGESWAADVAREHFEEIGLREAEWRAALADGASCRFQDWEQLIGHILAEAGEAARPLADLAQACGGTKCLPLQTGRFEAAAAILQLPGGEKAPSEAARRFLPAARELAACARSLPPPAPASWETEWGLVRIAGDGPDEHKVTDGVALLVDTGGDDVWHLAPPEPGRFRVLLDLAGNDRWLGDSTARLSISATMDLAGADRYESFRGGVAAALGGAAFHVDARGDDSYRTGEAGQASAQAGLAILIEGGGDDRYTAHSRSQAFAGPGASAVLWDLAGNDLYEAAGEKDPEGRGPWSWSQGVGTGRREGLGGGSAILIDESGDDIYRAGLFAQGAGYYDGLGLVIDRAGDDRYSAARYAQGAGVHRAVGALLDEAGDDTYLLDAVGQGMGLDMAAGLLRDRAGDDRYEAGSLAQAASTDNGIGILADGGGRNLFRLAGAGWGRDHIARALPGLAYFLAQGPGIVPHNPERPEPQAEAWRPCPTLAIERPSQRDWLALLRQSWPVAENGLASASAVASALPEAFPALLAAIPQEDFETGVTLREIVRCWMARAPEAERDRLGTVLLDQLATGPKRHPWVSGTLLARSDMPPARMAQAGAIMAAHPSCGIRAAGLRLLQRFEPTAPALAAARRDPCLAARAAALMAAPDFETIIRIWPALWAR